MDSSAPRTPATTAQAPSPDGDDQVLHDFYPRFRVYKNGRVQRFRDIPITPPSADPEKDNVLTRDVVVSPETGVSARIFLPNGCQGKLPLLIQVHGGAFSLFSAFSTTFHNYVSSLVSLTNMIAVSVEYRLAPEHPVPACYDDTWSVLQWVASHRNANGPDPWLNDHADVNRVVFVGESAGANIIHNMLVRLSDVFDPTQQHLNISAAALVHPFFGNNQPDDLWACVSANQIGLDDPRLNPSAHPTQLAKLRCPKVLICVAEKDNLKDRGVTYYQALKKSGWNGEVEIVETEGEDHVFYLFNPEHDKSLALLERVASFLKEAAA